MNYEQISYLVMIGISLSYITGTLIAFGITPSISETFYRLKDLHRRFLFWDISILFPMWSGFTAITALLCTDGNIWITIAATGLLLVGAAPYFKNILNKSLHYLGAVTALIYTLCYTLFHLHYYGLTMMSIGALIGIIVTKDKNSSWMYWVEIIAFVSFFVASYFNLFV